ncbi:hypothetical protein SteCoe_5138 [Stentor coeruleus]|uniref:Tubulin alpha chain n=1 Tax=Stentor coeruleus TaxID=5963 RepID=A0A1R2CT03_9CILI|nr:hypothetical protein SteCoe_5138 [Stentor coeruleus]
MCLEHNINEIGRMSFTPDNHDFTSFYSEIRDEVYSPRALFIDTDPVSIDWLSRSQYTRIYNPNMLISSKEDSGGVFCRTMTDLVTIDLYMEKIRTLVEACDNLQGFNLYFAAGGGTGSGISSMILDSIKSEYQNKNIMSFVIYPSPEVPKGTLNYYNSTLATDYLIKHSDSIIVLDNKALFSICKNELHIEIPSFNQLNRVASLTINSITSNFRFPNGHFSSPHDISQLLSQGNKKFLTTSFAPISNTGFSEVSLEDLSILALSDRYSNIGCYEGPSKSYACSITYRGDVDIENAEMAVKACFDKKYINFIDESTKLPYGVNSDRPGVYPHGEIVPMSRSACVINNSQRVKGFFGNIDHKFCLLFAKRAFVYHYCASGIEEGELCEAIENLIHLENEYEDKKVNE